MTAGKKVSFFMAGLDCCILKHDRVHGAEKAEKFAQGDGTAFYPSSLPKNSTKNTSVAYN
jgi:hypothetical protein